MDTKLDIRSDIAAEQSRRAWATSALELIRAEKTRGTHTPLVPFSLPVFGEIDVYLKDESSHPTGSLKHRLARSLFVHALCSGDIGPDTPIIEASSGSTAVSEAYFARIIGVPFIAVVPRTTSQEKIDLIERYDGQCRLAEDSTQVVTEAQRLAAARGGYFMDQFTFAAQATNWRCDNIAEELFEQMRNEPHPLPQWVVVGAGTGGTSTTIARFARYNGFHSRLTIVDPEGSAFYDGWRMKDTTITTTTPSRIEGIGRTRVEPSFFPHLVDEVLQVPDAASVAAMRWVSEQLGRRVGASTGTNIWGTIQLAQRMNQDATPGSIVSLICDAGSRYTSTYYNDAWLTDNGINIAPYTAALRRFERTGTLAVD
ncbi:PLP-dependent cysteine synthase family protein [Saccharopolyspora hattusasensis]|uniref:PLP-dependent cysteine synthase family protein n=1 Tax=Saccharopolyspora hattusasensis TaxID=1128679 RepID=UPI003D95E766